MKGPYTFGHCPCFTAMVGVTLGRLQLSVGQAYASARYASLVKKFTCNNFSPLLFMICLIDGSNEELNDAQPEIFLVHLFFLWSQ